MNPPVALNDFLAHLRTYGLEFQISKTLRHEEDIAGSSLQNMSSPRTLCMTPELTLQEHHAQGLGATHATMTLARTLCSDVRIAPGMNVLELGSGTGVLSITAAMMGAQVTSMELDPAANELARQNFEVAGLPHRIISTDILNSKVDSSGIYSLIIANLPHKPVPSDGDLPLANDGGPHGTEVFEAVLPFLKSSLDRQGEFLFLQHSLPSPSFLITLQKDFELTLCAWRQRFINANEFPKLMPYWMDRHATGESYVSNINEKQALIFCAWRAMRRTSHR